MFSKDARALLANAWIFTLRRFSFWDRVFTVLSAVIPPLLLWIATPNAFKWADAMNDFLKILICVGVIVGVFALRFAWNLWLAPYRLRDAATAEQKDQIKDLQAAVDAMLKAIIEIRREIPVAIAQRLDTKELAWAQNISRSESLCEELAKKIEGMQSDLGVTKLHWSDTIGNLAVRLHEVEKAQTGE